MATTNGMLCIKPTICSTACGLATDTCITDQAKVLLEELFTILSTYQSCIQLLSMHLSVSYVAL